MIFLSIGNAPLPETSLWGIRIHSSNFPGCRRVASPVTGSLRTNHEMPIGRTNQTLYIRAKAVILGELS